MRKILLMLCLSLLATYTAAAYDFSAQLADGKTLYFNYNEDGTSVSVTSKTLRFNSYSGDVVIPTVVSDPDGNLYTVTGIGGGAFKRCVMLTSVIIPPTVNYIGIEAFMSSLPSSITIENNDPSAISMGDDVFSGISSSCALYVPRKSNSLFKGSDQWNTFQTIYENPYDLAAVNADHVTIYYEINSDESSVSVTFRDYYYNSYSGNISVPNEVINRGTTYGVTSIGENAFDSCNGLTGITLPASLTDIDNYAFNKCSSLTQVTIPDAVSYIGFEAFADCTGLKAFYGKYASDDNRCLIVDGDLRMFARSGLTSYDIPATATSISFRAFAGCSALTALTIPSSVTVIGGNVFYGCTGLTTLTIPVTVIAISDCAFAGCSALTSLTVENNLPSDISLGDDVFSGVPTSTCSLNVPKDSGELYSDAVQWCDFKCINESPYHFAAVNPEGVTIYYEINADCRSVSVTYREDVNSYAGSVAIPAEVINCGFHYEVTAIGDYAFNMCSGVTDVTIPATVTSIGEKAFGFCSKLTDITIPERVTEIGNNSFNYCSNLEKVEIPASVTSIGDYAFYKCKSIKSVWVDNPYPADIEMGENVFGGVSVASATLYVPSGSKTLYGEAPQWNAFNIVETLNGDVNFDGEINVSDVTTLIGMIVDGAPYDKSGDVNSDGEINVSDITSIISIIIGE